MRPTVSILWNKYIFSPCCNPALSPAPLKPFVTIRILIIWDIVGTPLLQNELTGEIDTHKNPWMQADSSAGHLLSIFATANLLHTLLYFKLAISSFIKLLKKASVSDSSSLSDTGCGGVELCVDCH